MEVELNWNRAWTAIHLVQNGVTIEANARHCPVTMGLLERPDQPAIPNRSTQRHVLAARAGDAHIPPHNGVANTRLVCHLPLIVPPGCWFRVGAERAGWKSARPGCSTTRSSMRRPTTAISFA